MALLEKIKQLPIGYSQGIYQSKKYGITRIGFNKGKSIKVYAKALGGTDFISLNYYITSNNELLKPCEMPEKKVIDFLNQIKIINR